MIIDTRLPIGIFDSGLGGLTVVKEVARILPQEKIIYVGDTARVPYGTKSPDTIRRYALQIAFFLLQRKVKAIVVACNTVSAVALKALKGLPIPVIGVLDPGARAAVLKTSNLKIGVIGTPATVGSHAYRSAIHRYSPKAVVWEQACPLFVPLVEAGWGDHPTSKEIATIYLAPLLKKKIDTLVLGCTHYPLMKGTLSQVAGPRVRLIDSGEETAKELKALLTKHQLHADGRRAGGITTFVTDNPDAFSHLGRNFFAHNFGPARRLSLESL